MNAHSKTKAPQEIRTNTSSTSEDGEAHIKIKKNSRASNDESNKSLGIDEESSSSFIDSVDSGADEGARPTCPSTVNHIINTLSAVGTFGGLALITTGGMGTTLNKPIDNNIANVAMVVGGGALLLGSLIGNLIYTNNQTA